MTLVNWQAESESLFTTKTLRHGEGRESKTKPEKNAKEFSVPQCLRGEIAFVLAAKSFELALAISRNNDEIMQP